MSYNLKLETRTWSNYTHHHTCKAVIGILPCKSVSFLSEMWGRILDKELTERIKSYFYASIYYGDGEKNNFHF